MTIPGHESIMLPLLKHISDGKTYTKAEVTDAMAKHFKLTAEDVAQLVKSGTPLFAGRVHWAIQYMLNAQLVSRPARAQVAITKRGKELLAEQPPHIDNKLLKQYSEFTEWQGRKRDRPRGEEREHEATPSQITPDEHVERGYKEIRNTLATELLDKALRCSPAFFEHLVLELLVKMGYGGTVEQAEAARVTGKSGDGGIDGIIKEDKLGLDIIYVQAKRWQGVVGEPVIRDFSGSLDPHGAKKGVIITTSGFTKEAREYARKLGEKKIVLIDGIELAQLMIDHDIGVSTVTTYSIKRIDSDYFEE
jgi:restriction system protein